MERGATWMVLAACVIVARVTSAQEAASRATLGPEPPALARLRGDEAQRAMPGNLAAAADRASVTLPPGLGRDLAARMQMPSLDVRVTPRLLGAIERIRTDLRSRRQLTSWMRHAQRYRGRIEAALAEAGLPVELVWLVAMESEFEPCDVSGVGATGLWQLMADTARSYGLRVDGWVDERRDPDASTRAATAYLRDLHARLGSWELALAAYNMGYAALLRSVRKYDSNDFDTLASLEAGLPYETVQYVPRILAATVAVPNATLLDIHDLAFDAVRSWDDVPLARSLPLDAIARAIHVDLAALRALNPAVLHGRTPPADAPRPFVLHVPRGSAAASAVAIAAIHAAPTRVVRLRMGETVDEIARSYGVHASDVAALSGMSAEMRVDARTELLVPDRAPDASAPTDRPLVPVDAVVADAPAGRRRVFYRATGGERIESLADAVSLHVDEIAQWNRLDGHATLQAGMWVQLFVASTPDDVRLWGEREVDLIERGSEGFYDRAARSDGRVRMRVAVRAGDTMASIAARYGVPVASLARVNQRPHASTLTPGENLVVYAPASPPIVESHASPAPSSDASAAPTEASSAPPPSDGESPAQSESVDAASASPAPSASSGAP